MSRHAFSELRTAAYCPRQLYYHRREGFDPPDVSERRDLAFRYAELLDADDATLARLPIDVSPAAFRQSLRTASQRFDDWDELVDPETRDTYLRGREAHGIVHKLPGTDPPVPSLVFVGSPPETGVWEPHSVGAVAAAKALAWERKRPVERAYVEYPTHGVVRSVELTTRRKAVYRRTVRAVESIDGPPPRIDNKEKCSACEYADECGVRTRSLRSLLGW